MSTTSAHAIQVAADDLYDRPYRFAQPLNYLSQREQARLLILRGRLHDQPRAELGLNPTLARADRAVLHKKTQEIS
jgi:hypothetical protein